MPSALILIADGTEEIEFVTPYDGKLYTCRTVIESMLPLLSWWLACAVHCLHSVRMVIVEQLPRFLPNDCKEMVSELKLSTSITQCLGVCQ
jgi:hypothetical protein